MKKYTKEQILIAAEIGEVSMIDARHLVSLLDESVILERERKLRKHNVSGELAVNRHGVYLVKARTQNLINTDEQNKTS